MYSNSEKSVSLKVVLIILLFAMNMMTIIYPINIVKAATAEFTEVNAPDQAFNNGEIFITYSLEVNTFSDTSIEIILEEDASHLILDRRFIPAFGSPEDPISEHNGDVYANIPLYPDGDLPTTITLNLVAKEDGTILNTYPIYIMVVSEMEDYHAHIVDIRITESPIYAGNEFSLTLTLDMTLPEDSEYQIFLNIYREGDPFLIAPEPYYDDDVWPGISGVRELVLPPTGFYPSLSAPYSETVYTMIIEATLEYKLPDGDWQTDEEGVRDLREDVEIADFNWASIHFAEVSSVGEINPGSEFDLIIHVTTDFITVSDDEEYRLSYLQFMWGLDPPSDPIEILRNAPEGFIPDTAIILPLTAFESVGEAGILIYLEIWDESTGEWIEPGGNGEEEIEYAIHSDTEPERPRHLFIVDITDPGPVLEGTNFILTVEYDYYVEATTQAVVVVNMPVYGAWYGDLPLMLEGVPPGEERRGGTIDLEMEARPPVTPLEAGTYPFHVIMYRFHEDIDEFVGNDNGEQEIMIEVITNLELGDEDASGALTINTVQRSPDFIDAPFTAPTNFMIDIRVSYDYDVPVGEIHDINLYISDGDMDIIAGYVRHGCVGIGESESYQNYIYIRAPSTTGRWDLTAHVVIYEDDGTTPLYWDSFDFYIDVVEADEEAYVDWKIDRLLWGIEGSELAFEAEVSVLDTNLGYPQEGQVIFFIDDFPLGDPLMTSIGEGEAFTRATSDPWTPELGSHTLRAEVTSIPPETENNPDDNVLELTINVGSGLPDMPPAPPYDIPPEPFDGEDFDFAISIDPSIQTVRSGEEAIFPVDVSLISGESAPVSLSVIGLLEGASYVFDNPTGTPGFNTNLRIAVSNSMLAGTYMLSVKGEGPGVTHGAVATLVVEDNPNRSDFSLSVAPEILTIKQGERGSARVSVSSERGYDKLVNLKLLGLPIGVFGSFSQSAGTPSYSPTLTLDIGEQVPTGEYLLTITASGSGMRQENIRLIVEGPEEGAPGGVGIADYTTPVLGILILAVIGASAVWLIRRRKPGKPKKPAKIPRKITGYCIECGAPIHADDEFCPKCGEPQKGKS
ncbi:MAG: hypothetical protein NWF08_09990 [Candidatus Bathyarchaeota archaeon]|nr:hypothetical protein [Candidatus Bathyarchaeota archaeon]